MLPGFDEGRKVSKRVGGERVQSRGMGGER